MGKQTRERQLKLEARIVKLKSREKELRISKDRIVARFERTCQLLRRLNQLREEQCELLKEKFRLTLHLQVDSEVQSRVQRELQQVRTLQQQIMAKAAQQDHAKENVAGNQDCASSSNVVDKMQRMEIELRCGICSELMVSATTLNCMHTFCQYCVTQWKNFEKNRAPIVGCPVCRESITSERRNFSMDNIIGIIVDGYSEDEKNNRKELMKQHQELSRNLLTGERQPNTSNPFYQITNRNVFIGEMRVEEMPSLPRINLQNVTRRRSLSSVTSRPATVRRLQQGSVRPRWR
ncbi:E3 ubiquitin-protein ligase rnf8-B-like [Daphnia pulex]|uniref:E3 ubiquitin-protein ligase rnf8-B-like n=1 Tax=Daphnia pulex TaxID=6669 RepID=UPI001EE04E6E|nr:E3 ubiquitin-protein ligase rnf8-B-like [Daphnia pulex]